MHRKQVMSRGALLLFASAVCVAFVAGDGWASVRASQPEVSEDAGPIAWGPVRAGVQFGLQLAAPRKSYTFGQAVALMVKARNLGHRPVTLRTGEPFFREHAPTVEAPDPWSISAQGVANYSGTVPQSVVTLPGGGAALIGRPVYALRPRYPEDKSQLPALFAEAGNYQLRFSYYPEKRVVAASSFAVLPAGPAWETGSVRLAITGQGRDPEMRSFASSGDYLGGV